MTDKPTEPDRRTRHSADIGAVLTFVLIILGMAGLIYALGTSAGVF